MWRSLAGAGALVVRDERVLMVYRERSGQTRWELPSGTMQEIEAFEETAARETCEETGVQIQIGALLCTVVMHVPAEAYRGINVYFHGASVRRCPQYRSTSLSVKWHLLTLLRFDRGTFIQLIARSCVVGVATPRRSRSAFKSRCSTAATLALKQPVKSRLARASCVYDRGCPRHAVLGLMATDLWLRVAEVPDRPYSYSTTLRPC